MVRSSSKVPLKQLPSWEELIDRYEYLPQLGRLVFKALPEKYFNSERLMNSYNSKFAGSFVGGKESQGYIQVRIGDSGYKAHRLIWKWVTGEEPSLFIDHLDGDRSNNRFENLRDDVTSLINSHNRSKSMSNISGTTGVSWRPRERKWVARGKHDFKDYYLGCYDSFEDACRARHLWQERLDFTQRHGL